MMQKNNLISFFLFCFFVTSINAQQIDNFNGLFIKISPLQLVMGEARVQLEKPFKNKKSLEITLGYVWDVSLIRDDYVISSYYGNSLNSVLGYPADLPIRNGGKLGIGYSFYRKKSDDDRIYFKPFIFYKMLDYKNTFIDTPFNINYHIVSIQLQYGKCQVSNKFILDYYVGFGARYKYGKEILSKRKLESWIYPSINFGINIGYNFINKSK